MTPCSNTQRKSILVLSYSRSSYQDDPKSGCRLVLPFPVCKNSAESVCGSGEIVRPGGSDDARVGQTSVFLALRTRDADASFRQRACARNRTQVVVKMAEAPIGQ